MSKKYWIVLFFIVSVFLIFFIFRGEVTYEDKLQDLIGNEDVEKIEISDSTRSQIVTVENPKDLQNIISPSSKLSLEEYEGHHDPKNDYFLNLYTKESEYLIVVGSSTISRLPGATVYKVLGDNDLYETITNIIDTNL